VLRLETLRPPCLYLLISLTRRSSQSALSSSPLRDVVSSEVLVSLERNKMPLDSTVLVVDDDPLVLDVAAAACEEIGLTVLRAQDGAGALEVLRENPEVELLLTDIAMPNMTGWELAHEAN
jgi:PleD family two-component response regulator